MTVSVSLLISLSVCKQSCTTCLFISKSFKELFFVAFFAKADAKVRRIFELPKLFEEIFQKKVFWWSAVQNLISVQHFNSSAFLSRKRMQNYCFTTYLPNTSSTFFSNFCNFFAKSLIFKYAVEHKKVHSMKTSGKLHLIIIYIKRSTKYTKSSSGTSNSLKSKKIRWSSLMKFRF